MYYLSYWDVKTDANLRIVDEETLIETRVSNDEFCDLLFNGKIRHNGRDGITAFDANNEYSSPFRKSITRIMTTGGTYDYLTNGNFGVTYFVSTSNVSWRKSYITACKDGTILYISDREVCIWNWGYLYRITNIRLFISLCKYDSDLLFRYMEFPAKIVELKLTPFCTFKDVDIKIERCARQAVLRNLAFIDRGINKDVLFVELGRFLMHYR